MVLAKKYILKSHFQSLPKREDLEIVEEELPPLKDGGKKQIAPSSNRCRFVIYVPCFAPYLAEFLTETLWLSVDPYMRYV